MDQLTLDIAVAGNGECLEGGICKCNNKTIGESCNVECVNGYSVDGTECICNLPCITGYTCNSICNNNGQCDEDGNCVCDFDAKIKGDQCDSPGCPGEPDCSGPEQGNCIEATGECKCENGWRGDGCEIANCDCNNVPALCEKRDGDKIPRCYNCSKPYIGANCEKR